jgi:hypothetical protein
MTELPSDEKPFPSTVNYKSPYPYDFIGLTFVECITISRFNIENIDESHVDGDVPSICIDDRQSKGCRVLGGLSSYLNNYTLGANRAMHHTAIRPWADICWYKHICER